MDHGIPSPRPKRGGLPRSVCSERSGRISRLVSQSVDDAVDFSVEQNTELLQLWSAKRRKKRGGAVVADNAANFFAIEQGQPERHIEARANIDGDDLVGDDRIADEIEHAALHFAR